MESQRILRFRSLLDQLYKIVDNSSREELIEIVVIAASFSSDANIALSRHKKKGKA